MMHVGGTKSKRLKVLVFYNHVPSEEADAPTRRDAAVPPEGAGVDAAPGEAAAEVAPGDDASALGTGGAGSSQPGGSEAAVAADSSAAADSSEDGGDSSGASAQSEGSETADAEQMAAALRDSGYDVILVNLDDDIDRIGHAVVVHRPDAIVNMVDQMWGEALSAAAVCQFYDMYGYPFVGSDTLALTTCQERARTHLMLDDADIPVPGFVIVRDVNAIPDTGALDAPLIVTQAFDDIYELEGVTHPLATRDEVEGRIAALATEYDMPLLIEEFIDGRRIQALVVGNRVLDVKPLTERYYDEDEGLETIGLAQLDLDTADRIRQLARRAFRAMSLRDVAQIDFVIDDDGSPYVVDVRPAFDTGPSTSFWAAAEASEGGLAGVVDEIVRSALARAGLLAQVPAAATFEDSAPPAEERSEDVDTGDGGEADSDDTGDGAGGEAV